MHITYYYLDKNLLNHIHTASKCRDLSILQLIAKYNKIISEIKLLIGEGKAPLGAHALQPIERVGIFALNVDDLI